MNKKIYTLQKIETKHLIIRPIKHGDEVQLNHAINNSLELLQKWQPWAKNPSIEATRSFVQHGVTAWETGNVINFPMAVIHKIDKKIIGASGYNERSKLEEDLYEIGYWCDVDYQGHGFVTEYVNALSHYAFEALDAKKVVVTMHVDNIKSIAVAKRLHFINEGIKDRDRKDCVSSKAEKNYLYSITNAHNLPKLDVSWTHK